MKNCSESESAQLKFPRGAAVKLVGKVESRGLDIQLRMDINIIECIFLSQGRHYDSFPDFTPSSDANNWCLTDSQH